MKLSDMRARVAGAIGLDNTNGGLEQGLIDSWTNEACVDFLERTKVKVEQFEMTLTSGQGDYELPSGILVVNSIEVTNFNDGQVVPIEPIPMEEMLWRRRYPGAVPVRYYTMQGYNLLSLYPTTLVNATDDIATVTGIPAQFHYILELNVKWKAADYNDDAGSQNGMAYFQQYSAEVIKARGRIRREQGRRRPPALPGRRSRRKYYPAYPSQDTGVE